MRKKKMMKK